MEIRDIVKRLIKHNKILLIFVALGSLIGIGIYFLPHKYQASGSIFIRRAVQQPLGETFSYEGYYGQQTAIAHTNSVFALAESIDIKNGVLNKLKINSTEKALRELGKKIKVKKTGPQIITLTVEDYSKNNAGTVWETLVNTVIQKNTELNKNGDPLITIAYVSQDPVVKSERLYIWQYLSVGFLSGACLGILFISLKEYLK